MAYQHIINENTILAVWDIEERESFFSEEIGLITGIDHPQRRLEFMAGRYLLKLLAPSLDILSLHLSPAGKPIDPAGNIHFSISHSKNKVAVIVSEDFSVGLDIQFSEEKLISLQHKFLSEKDQVVLSQLNHPELIQFCFGWSVKESLFKWYGKGQVNFIEHIHIEQLKCVGNVYYFQCRFSKEEEQYVNVKGFLMDNHVLTYTIT